MSTPTTHTDEILLLAETLGEVKSRTEKLESEFSAQARPLEAATTALQAALAGIKSLQFHVLDNNLGQLSARVEQYRATISEQVEVIATELKRADEDNAKKSGEAADGLRAELAALRENLGQVVTQFGQQLERVQLEAAQKAKEFAAIPGQPGPAGRSISGRGAYVAGSRYNAGDVVSFVGGSYLSNEDDNDEKPGAKAKRWTQLVGRGPGGGVSDVKGLTGISQNLIAWLADPTSALSIGALTASGNLTLTGAVLLGGATGGMPSAGVINAKGFKIDGVDVGTSTDTYWSASGGGIAYNAGPVTIGATTSSTSSTTGAAIIGGGVGVAENIVQGGYLRWTGNSTLPGVGSIGKSATYGLNLYAATGSSYDFALFSAAGNSVMLIPVGTANTIFPGVLQVSNTTDSSTALTGALVISGGLGVAKKVSIAGGIAVYGALNLGAGYTTLGGGFQFSYENPVGRIFYGDGSGYALHFSTRAASTTTDRVTLSDTGILTLNATTDSTTKDTGALVVEGGVGVEKAIVAGTSIKSVSATAGIGYGTGAGGSETQLTSKSTTVVLNKVCGRITTSNATLNAGAVVAFTLTNSAIADGDTVMVCHISGGTISAYTIFAGNIASGSASIYIRNNTAGNLSESLVLSFFVFKTVTS